MLIHLNQFLHLLQWDSVEYVIGIVLPGMQSLVGANEQQQASMILLLPLLEVGLIGFHCCIAVLCVNSEGFLAEVFHPWVRWEGPGSGVENLSGGGGAGKTDPK